MKRPGFFNGVAAALVFAAAASIGVAVIGPLVAAGTLFKLGVPVIALGYIVYLLSRSPERVGRVTTLALWAVLCTALWVVEPPLALYGLIHLGAIWLIRSLYFYSGVLPALADFGLCGLSLACAIWAARHTGSVFMAAWCFFLVQALFALIPPSLAGARQDNCGGAAVSDDFAQAHRRAEAAVRQLFAN